jgi:hypothetical protein
MKSTSEMPEINQKDAIFDTQKGITNFQIDFADWFNSLQKCEITNYDFKKIHDYLLTKKSINTFTCDFNTPIEITDIVCGEQADGLFTVAYFKLSSLQNEDCKNEIFKNKK